MAYIYQIDRVLLQKQIARFARYVAGHVLDAGSGGHNRYGHLYHYGSLVRLDIVPGPNVDVVGRIEAMPFKDNEFDSVISTQVFEHLSRPEQAAIEIYRVLKPGGHALITAPQWNELHEEPHDYWRYTRFGLQELFERNGFEAVVCDQRGGYFANAAQMRVRYLIDLLGLHRHWWGRLFSAAFKIYGTIAIALDHFDHSAANRKHAIGWLFVFKKK